MLEKYPNFYQIFIPLILSIVLFISKIPQRCLQKYKKRRKIFQKKQYLQDSSYLKRELEIQEILQGTHQRTGPDYCIWCSRAW
ncbi:hypothetical protein SaSA201_0567 [Streptococcus agalactiae]|nr:hypothetical protein SaSA201_0567 [Streptococcus agalactiae]AUP15956.1 hypothetical protein SaSA209_0568 [Streptococcus agalactiae]